MFCSRIWSSNLGVGNRMPFRSTSRGNCQFHKHPMYTDFADRTITLHQCLLPHQQPGIMGLLRRNTLRWFNHLMLQLSDLDLDWSIMDLIHRSATVICSAWTIRAPLRKFTPNNRLLFSQTECSAAAPLTNATHPQHLSPPRRSDGNSLVPIQPLKGPV